MAKNRMLVRQHPFEVLWEVDREVLECLSVVDDTVLMRAERKIKRMMKQGRFDRFRLYAEDIRSIPLHVARGLLWPVSQQHVFRFVLASGFCQVPGVVLEEPLLSDAAFDLSLVGVCGDTKYADFLNTIELKARELGFEKGCCAQLCSVFERWRFQGIKRHPIFKASHLPRASRGFDIFVAPSNDALVAAISDPMVITLPEKRLMFRQAIKDFLKEHSSSYRFELKGDLWALALFEWSRGKQALGIGLPTSIYLGACTEVLEVPGRGRRTKGRGESVVAALDALGERGQGHGVTAGDDVKEQPRKRDGRSEFGMDGAVGGSIASKHDSSEAGGQRSNLLGDDGYQYYLGRGLLKVAIDKLGLEAKIEMLDLHWVDDDDIELNESWLENEMCRYNLALRQPDLLAAIMDCIREKKDVAGMTLCRAELGQPPSEGKLWVIDADRRFVGIGDVFCRWQFENPGEPGINVFGETIATPSAELPKVTLGDGVRIDDEGFFVAEVSGIPVVTENPPSVAISEVYVVEGDFMQADGPLVFDGVVQIEGTVKNGSSIVAGKGLLVGGNVESSTVRSHMGMKVEGGITNSKVVAKSNIEAAFIEFSEVFAGGQIVCQTSILGGETMGTAIEILEQPGILAGNVFCYERISCHALGVPNSPSEVYLGIDPMQKRRQIINDARLQRIEARVKVLEADVGYLKKSRRRDKSALPRMEIALEKGLRIVQVLRKRRSSLNAELKGAIQKKPCEARVTGLVATNVVLHSMGEKQRIHSEYKNVLIVCEEKKILIKSMADVVTTDEAS